MFLAVIFLIKLSFLQVLRFQKSFFGQRFLVNVSLFVFRRFIFIKFGIKIKLYQHVLLVKESRRN